MVRNRTKKLEVDENQEANKSQKDDCVECRVDEGAVNCREDVEAYGENTGRFGSERTEMKLCVLNVLNRVQFSVALRNYQSAGRLAPI